MSSFQIGISIDRTAWCFIVPCADVFGSLSSAVAGPKDCVLEACTSLEFTIAIELT